MATEARPVRHLGEAFEHDGVWWRQGKLGPYLITDQLDTSRVWVGKPDPFCAACGVGGLGHSLRQHYDAVQASRRRAVCHPHRSAARLAGHPPALGAL